MARDKWVVSYSWSYEPQYAWPLDARMKCETKADLTLQSTREANDNNVYVHPWMMVAVYNDADPENNWIYVLLDYDYTDINNWKFIWSSVDSKEYKDFIVRRWQETWAELLDDNIYTLQLNKYDSTAPAVTYYRNDWSTYSSTTTWRIHWRIYSNWYVFWWTRSLPARLVRIPVDKPEDWDQITLPDDDEHWFLEDFAIDERTWKIYWVTSDVSYSHQTWIIEIDPKSQTLNYVDWLKLDMNWSSSWFPTVFCKDWYLYVWVWTQDSKLYKIEIDTKTIIWNVQIGSWYNARMHSINSDWEYLFVTCTSDNAKIVRLDFDLNILEQRTFNDVWFTDEFVIWWDYLYVWVDTANYWHAISVWDTLRRVNKLDFNDVYTYHFDDALNNVPIYEVRFVDKYVVVVYNTSPSRLFFINPETNEVFEKQINVDYINSITTDWYYTLMSNRVEWTWTFIRTWNLKKTKVLDEYIDNKVINIQADNWLHNDSWTIKLGWNLIENTNINLNGNNFVINNWGQDWWLYLQDMGFKSSVLSGDFTQIVWTQAIAIWAGDYVNYAYWIIWYFQQDPTTNKWMFNIKPNDSSVNAWMKIFDDWMAEFITPINWVTLTNEPDWTVNNAVATVWFIKWILNTLEWGVKTPDWFATTSTWDYPTDYKWTWEVNEWDTFVITDITNWTTVWWQTVNVWDFLIAKIDNPWNTDSNWLIVESNRDQATETILWVARIATQAEVDAWTDDTTIVTPLKLKTRWTTNISLARNWLTKTWQYIELWGNLIQDTTISSTDDKFVISTTQNTDDSVDPWYAKWWLHLENTYNWDSYQRWGKIWNTWLMYDYSAWPYDDYVTWFSMVEDSDASSVPVFNPNNDTNYYVDGDWISLFLTRFFFQVYNNRWWTFRYRAFINAHDIIFENNDVKLTPDEIKPSSVSYPTKYARTYNNINRFEADTNHIPNVWYVQQKVNSAINSAKTDETDLTADVAAWNVVMTLSNTPLLNSNIKVYVNWLRQKWADFSVDTNTWDVTTNIDLQNWDNIIIDYYA